MMLNAKVLAISGNASVLLTSTYLMSRSTEKFLSAIKNYSQNLFGFIAKRVATREDAEDILQEVWFQLSRIVKIEDIENLSGWLFQVARNQITDNYRKKGDESTTSIAQDDSFLLSEYRLPDDGFLKELFWEELFRALDDLPELQRTAFVQNELEDKTLQQIADEAGENLKTIISRKRYAVKHLRARMQIFYNDLID